ncbi:hypothetical protein CDL15_Pgr017920 [Punica granatum]|uniref:Uncharacterized protein n=1 Tax=Punica granatum TaxID=22663 RepID=A0A218WGS5_PUNGR|nr:hypothetical protein CDL15_Pgr017920 [Punica granatum]
MSPVKGRVEREPAEVVGSFQSIMARVWIVQPLGFVVSHGGLEPLAPVNR